MTVTSADTTNGCGITRIYTISAVDGCLNGASGLGDQHLDGQPHGVEVGERAGEPEPGLQSGQRADGGVFAEPDQRDQRLRSGDGDGDERGHDQRLRDTRIYTISAVDGCLNGASASVTNTWTANHVPLKLVNVPANQNLGCDPASVPTAAYLQSQISATNGCGAGTVTVTSADTTNGCGITRIYTISAVDGCLNGASATVTNTWTANPRR